MSASIESFVPVRKCQPLAVSGRRKCAKADSFFCAAMSGRFARIEADEDHFVVAAGIERKHLQRADDALLDLIAEHRAAVIDKREEYRLARGNIRRVATSRPVSSRKCEVSGIWPLSGGSKPTLRRAGGKSRGGVTDVAGHGLRGHATR